MMINNTTLQILHNSLSGDVLFDNLHKTLYATDASVYRKIPLAVAFPKDENDIVTLIKFATNNNITLIPRTAGTSLAGQCVGDGIVVDVSKYFTSILAFDEEAKTITVEPGIIRDDLNRFLKPFGLFFGPNTSTSNRCMIGGMVGNNSSGSTSIKYGVTRDKVLSIDAILSDGSSAFSDLEQESDQYSTEPTQIIDYAHLEHLKQLYDEDGQPLIRGLIDIYIKNADEILANLKQAAKQQDFEEIRRLAHSLKSSSGNLGLSEVTQLSRSIELRCQRGDVDVVDDEIVLLANACRQANEVLVGLVRLPEWM